jgi:hypothetical protein
MGSGLSFRRLPGLRGWLTLTVEGVAGYVRGKLLKKRS